jgi:glutathione S-transferase
MIRIVGTYISPYVRKVLACLHLKDLAYEIDPLVPFYGNEEFARISPVRRIPVLMDGDLTLADSTVICEYLDEAYGGAPLYPADPARRARARWLEEYADSRLGEALIWGLFNQRVINRFVWNQPPDEGRLARALEQDVPELLDYLEGEVPADGFLFGSIAVADVAIAAFFRNAAFAGFGIDSARWPLTARFVARVLDQPALTRLRPFEELCMRTPIAGHHEALAAAGAPVSTETFATPTPRRGILRT